MIAKSVLPDSAVGPRSSLAALFVLLGGVAAGVLVYVFGSFILADILGIKRELQGLLLPLLGFGAVLRSLEKPAGVASPLAAFALISVATEVVVRGNNLYVADGLAALMGIVLVTAGTAAVARSVASVVVILSALFATMGLVQQVAFYLVPEWDMFRLAISDQVTVLSGGGHPIAWLGLCSDQNWDLFGRAIGRCGSFTREPSLVLVYFLLPACLGLMLNRIWARNAAAVILVFSVLSFSGSVLLSITFGALLLLLRIGPRLVFPWGSVLLFLAYLGWVRTTGIDFLLQLFQDLGEVNSLLAKSSSITDRAMPAVANFDLALLSPWGAQTLSESTGPWLVNAALASGWLGVLALVLYLVALRGPATRVFATTAWSTKAGIVLFCGTMLTVVVFNDYQMRSFSGLMMLALAERTLRDIDTSNGPPAAQRRSLVRRRLVAAPGTQA